jgi:hypothetical protein
MFESDNKVVLSAPKTLQKTGLDLVNFGPFYESKASSNPWLEPLRPANYPVLDKETMDAFDMVLKVQQKVIQRNLNAAVLPAQKY